MQEYKMAEVQARFLEAEVGAKSRQRSKKPKGFASSRLESSYRMGVSNHKRATAEPKATAVPRGRGLTSVELFAGAGGLALGIEEAGFVHDTVVERNKDCCRTIRENQARGFGRLDEWRLFPGDVREFDYSSVKADIDLLAGGPPCQPFSIGGNHNAYNDERDMFPQVVRAVRELKPRAILVENVKGLTRKTFANYFSYIVLQLSHPEIAMKIGEDWTAHRDRLERYHTKGSWSGLEYNVVPRLLNSANYGVPQKRERVFFVGFRSDLGIDWTFPAETHAFEALLREQFVTGEYWDRHRTAKRNRPVASPKFVSRITAVASQSSLFEDSIKPWMTVRDALVGLPEPDEQDCREYQNHKLIPGARAYVGHTGSPLDEPAKTLKAGDHGVPGGENALLKPDGTLRYFTVREAARLQTFPDRYAIQGVWTEAMRQLGNAVPVQLGAVVAAGIRQTLISLR